MRRKRILLLAADSKAREQLATALREAAPALGIESAPHLREALQLIAKGRLDAAVCCVDAPDELAFVIRIKKQNPQTPVVVLSRVREPGFGTLAQSMGAILVPEAADTAETARSLALALETRALVKTQRTENRRTAELARDIRALAAQNRKLVGMALGMTAVERGPFTILIVEDDPAQSNLLMKSLSTARLPVTARKVESVKAAIDVLKGAATPSLVITDLNLGGRSGLELLSWVRGRTDTRLLSVIMLTSSEREEDIEEAYRRGVNLYLVKRGNHTEIVDVVRDILTQFNAQRAGLPLP